MVIAGGLIRSCVLKPRLLKPRPLDFSGQGFSFSPVHRESPSPAHSLSAPLSAGLPSCRLKRVPVRDLSGVWTASGLRDQSGAPLVSGLRELSGAPMASGLRDLSGAPTASGLGDLSGVWTASGLRDLSGAPTASGIRDQSGALAASGFRDLSGAPWAPGLRNLSGVWTGSGVRRFSGVWTGSGVRRFSGVWTGSGARGFSGVAGDEGSAGWYSVVSDSALVHLCEHFLVSVQQVSGLPWWSSIIVATLSVRTLVTLPLAAYQMVIIAKVEALKAEVSELAKRLKYEVSVRARERGWTEKQSRFQFKKNLRRLVSQLYIRDNCHPFKASLLVWVQLPLWISLSFALRNLSLDQSTQHSGLAAGGALWFPNLTAPDSTWILPVCLGLTNLLIVEVFSLQRVDPTRFQKFLTNFIRTISVLMIPVAATVPSSMALYWFVSSLVGFSHNLLLRSPTVHKILRLRTQRSESPYRDLLSAFTNKYFK
ncbi:cytochrome c oxidase assembly protein COX18, mitochondrial [Notolabrus celidotus]|uniref:cytochrome c oxidase assembly protein COX18, mitochondrial n=1 Tax=Notolabrus celidotus TaxID=1203425 RepID=UPI00148FB00D|nr:cytochrome c oxidase assembly protein COX18, mitochondrial [Notolabrus celidotus]XP_034545813.1 cytochrome c oxidase assembly protein COX18, mitochondrial [Notolabrus celidotus]XP_034545814.1 cytochrome c oxidase assembly protein COX18, mitochondrial [Notolabrus celidotus]